MADKKTRQLKPSILQEDLDAYAGMQGIAGYTPSNAAFNAANGETILQKMQTSQTKEVQAYAAWQASRDNKVADEWAFHEYVLSMRTQVKAQFGEDSNEVQAVGLKKKSDYKKPSKKIPAP